MSSSDDDDLDRLAELTAIWAYDGPHSTESVSAAAHAISALIRYINNATSRMGQYRYMSNAAIVAGSLAEATYGFDQLLDQMSTAIAEHIDAGDLYDDHCPRDPFAGKGLCSSAADRASSHRRRRSRHATVRAQQHDERDRTPLGTIRLDHRP